MNTVTIEYLIKNQTHFLKHVIEFEDYFDLEKNEKPSVHSVPKYSQPFQYLDIDLEQIVFLKLYFEIDKEQTVFRQTFWNDGHNFLTERIDSGNKNYHEIILSIKLDNENETYEVLRLYKSESFIVPTYHGLFHTDDTGSDVEQKFDTTHFIEMIKQGFK